jgi:hypothetical protein
MKQDDRRKLTRRRFVEVGMLGGVLAPTVNPPLEIENSAVTDPEREKLEVLVARYGSELGELRKVR